MSDETNSGNVSETTETTETATETYQEPEVSYVPEKDDTDRRLEEIFEEHERRTEQATLSEAEKQKKIDEMLENAKLEDGESWQAIYDNAPSNVQRAMASMRKDYVQKTQSLAEERKKLESLQSSLVNSDAFKAIQTMAQEEGTEFDPFNQESLMSTIKKMQAKALAEVLAPLQEQQLKAQAERNRQQFFEQHPDIQTDQTLRQEVYNVLQANENLGLSDAYYMVKGRMSESQMKTQAELERKKREADKKIGLGLGAARNKTASTVSSDFNNMTPAEIYAYFERNLK